MVETNNIILVETDDTPFKTCYTINFGISSIISFSFQVNYMPNTNMFLEIVSD